MGSGTGTLWGSKPFDKVPSTHLGRVPVESEGNRGRRPYKVKEWACPGRVHAISRKRAEMKNRGLRRGWVRHIAWTGIAAGLGLTLAACTSGEERERIEALPCPAVAILGDTEKLTVYKDGGRDITDLVLRAEIDQAVTQCEYDVDDGIIYVDIAYRGTAELGPGAETRQLSVPTFIALTEVNRSVLRKEIRPLNLNFSGGSRRIEFTQTIEETRVPYVAPFDGSAYELLVGFQLTADQLELNRAEKAARR